MDYAPIWDSIHRACARVSNGRIKRCQYGHSCLTKRSQGVFSWSLSGQTSTNVFGKCALIEISSRTYSPFIPPAFIFSSSSSLQLCLLSCSAATADLSITRLRLAHEYTAVVVSTSLEKEERAFNITLF